MEYNRIVAVTGLPGLYEVVSSKNDGALVRSLEDKSTRFVSSRVHNLSHLESIEIYTSGENVNLVDVFAAMKADGTALPDVKDAKALKAYFEKIYPEMDFERVYASDMKKMVKWFEVLNSNGVEMKITEQEEDTDTEEATAAEQLEAGDEKMTLDVPATGDTAETAKPKRERKKKGAE